MSADRGRKRGILDRLTGGSLPEIGVAAEAAAYNLDSLAPAHIEGRPYDGTCPHVDPNGSAGSDPVGGLPGGTWERLFNGANTKPSVVLEGIPDGSRIVVVSDCQIPLHDEALLRTIFEDFVPDFVPESGEYHLFLNGDILDNFSLSRFLARVEPRFTLGDELDVTRNSLRAWRRHFTHGHYVFGNHEDRWERYVFENAPAMATVLPSLADILELDTLGYDWVPYLRHYNLDGFIITHGDDATRHAADKMLGKYQASGVSGHANRPQMFSGSDAAKGENAAWFVQGMTARLDIGDVIKDWRRIQPWSQGFLIGEVQGGVVYVENVVVHHKKFRAAGKVYDVR